MLQAELNSGRKSAFKQEISPCEHPAILKNKATSWKAVENHSESLNHPEASDS